MTKNTLRMTASPDDDATRRALLNQMVQLIAAGDKQAFERFYALTASHVFAVIARMIRDRAEAQDLLQDVYMRAWRRADTFDPARGNAMTWLVTLARNRTIDRMREHREFDIDEAHERELEDEAPTPVDVAHWSQQRKRLEACLQALEAKQRGTVKEAFFSGATYTELADRYQVPLGTMKSWIRRSLLQLKLCLER
ncbi:RNA polymerase subunit sigma-24 [Trinickia dabaoshanensis]|uniref:RNA polymerase subunit sigma-24 n=1 Tax=Trinickia dabaoshanensis TaxID=564714 RepID=A0A2N7VBC4_9BURK|nr:sigma-70 family RNA polymerase sigma factor [Trinickia dabaoshanensis]PMS14473.1 RNA polymerase subunit sigma-24 [Trinickia dabaoshanensis]